MLILLVPPVPPLLSGCCCWLSPRLSCAVLLLLLLLLLLSLFAPKVYMNEYEDLPALLEPAELCQLGATATADETTATNECPAATCPSGTSGIQVMTRHKQHARMHTFASLGIQAITRHKHNTYAYIEVCVVKKLSVGADHIRCDFDLGSERNVERVRLVICMVRTKAVSICWSRGGNGRGLNENNNSDNNETRTPSG